VTVAPYGPCLLLAGTSGSGKSTLATTLLEQLGTRNYQFCIIDPEGDYEAFPGAVVLGSPQQPPEIKQVLELLQQPQQQAVVNLLGIAGADRPAFFAELLPQLQELRARSGRPHWIVVDEAHHMLHRGWDPAELTLPQALDSVVLITVHPESMAPSALGSVDTLIAVGEAPERTIAAFCGALGQTPPALGSMTLAPGEVVMWQQRDGTAPVRFHVTPPTLERRRHRRKYAQGDMGANSFVFRGPEHKLSLRAQNLQLFLQIADGVDDDTWRYHLERGDYTSWFQDIVKDEDLAAAAAAVAEQQGLDAEASRAQIRQAIEERYTLAA